MKNTHFLAAFIYAVLLIACGGSDQQDTQMGITDIKEFSDRTVAAMEQNTGRQKARKERGDTLAMPYAELKNYLPEASGYSPDGEPKGSQMNMPGVGSWSQVEQSFSSGDKQLRVTIVDYNGAAMAFAGATALYGMGFSQEDGEKRSGSTELGIEGVVAYETVYKNNPRAELIVVVADRFFITMNVEGTNEGTVLKEAARSMRLEELAKR